MPEVIARTRAAHERVRVMMMPASAGQPTRPIRLRDYAAWLAVGAVALTLLFGAQQAVRRGAAGIPPEWGPSLALNGLDWLVWGAFVPLIVAVGQRVRLDEVRGLGRATRVAVWIALGLVCVFSVAVITGLALREWPNIFLGSVPAGPSGASRGGPPPTLGRYLINWASSNFSFNTLIFGVIAGSFHAALYYRDLRARRLREADLEARLARAELNVLRMQLQPHFFFNALHTVSSLMLTDVRAAQGVIASLGTLLRSSIDHTARQEIALRDELAFVRHYLDVQVARFRQRLAVRVEVPEALLEALVPSLVLQPLVENAIRHGIEPNAEGGEIQISASRAGDDLVLRVSDDAGVGGEAPGPRSNGVAGGGGIGLTNIEARLAQLYGVSHTFRAGREENGRFSVTLRFPYHEQIGLYPTGLYPTAAPQVGQSPAGHVGQSPIVKEVAP